MTTGHQASVAESGMALPCRSQMDVSLIDLRQDFPGDPRSILWRNS